MIGRLSYLLVLVLFLCTSCAAADDAHPRLLLTAEDVQQYRESWQSVDLFAASLDRTRFEVDRQMAQAIIVPVPEDAGGGYTHEVHKRNAVQIYAAGMLYQWTGEPKYAEYAAELLLGYAAMYPGLGEHPQKKEQSPGRLFWQSLNEAVWMVYAIQGYDAIYTWLEESTREQIETGLFRPMASFLSVESPQTFDKIHNHGTWANAAVGMTGFVLGDDGLVNKALYGTKEDGEAGFIRQLDELFSPDGYYTEGPYYQRYALMPFVVFARSIDNNRPELAIFEYRDGVLMQAIRTTIQLSYADKFFPINDALKDKGLDTVELTYALAIAYGLTEDQSLLSLVNSTAPVILTGDGLRLAAGSETVVDDADVFTSMLVRDGADGDNGALGIIRNGDGPGHAALVVKATSQGMGHGHFDRLSWLFYDNGNEIVRDYGAARFLNVVQKYGGHYLPENDTWAKQTVAHNTLVVDERSHFDGSSNKGDEFPPGKPFFDLQANIGLLSAVELDAYDGVDFRRTLAMIEHDAFDQPVVLDILNVTSDGRHRYDLPLYFNGHIVDVSTDVEMMVDELRPVGDGNGYQHLWLLGTANATAAETFSVTWLLDNRFYTMSTVPGVNTEVLFTEIGANDPSFNLRNERGLMLRVDDARTYTFVSVLEPHGEYNGASEFTLRSSSRVKDLEHVTNDGKDIVRIETVDGEVITLALAHDASPGKQHTVDTPDGPVSWTGPYDLID